MLQQGPSLNPSQPDSEESISSSGRHSPIEGDGDGFDYQHHESELEHSSQPDAAAATAGSALPEGAYNAARLLKLLLTCNMSERAIDQLLQLLLADDFDLQHLPTNYRGLRKLGDEFVAAQTHARDTEGCSGASASLQARTLPAADFGLDGCLASSDAITAYTRDVRTVLVERLQTLQPEQLHLEYKQTVNSEGDR